MTCIDKLRFGGEGLLGVWGHPRFRLAKVDIADYAQVDDIFNNGEYFAVIHLAAIVGDPACSAEPELAKKTNWDASVHILEKAMRAGIARFIFASTCSNYGKMAVSEGYVDENAPLAPVSLYAELKVRFEKLVLSKRDEMGKFSPTALRFATVHGISPRMRFDLTVNEFTKELALGKELVVFGEKQWRPYCHVQDFSRAMMTVLKAREEAVAYKVFNVGDTGENYTKEMIVDELSLQIPKAKVRFVRKEGDDRNYRVNFDKIKRDLGFSISKTVPEGIKEILYCIKSSVIRNPDSQRYYNIARKQE